MRKARKEIVSAFRINRKTKPESYVMNLKALLLGGVVALLAGPAMAQSPTLYFGVHGGKTMTSTEVTNAPLNPNNAFSLDGLAGNGYVAGVHVGADIQFANSPVFVGVFGGADWGDNEFKLAFGSNAFTATLGNSYYLGGRAGVVVHGNTKVYALAAWRQSEWSSSVKNLKLDDPRGVDLGLGIETAIAKNVTIGLEAISTQYQKGEFLVGAQGVGSGFHGQIDQASLMARLSFALGSSSIFDDAGAAPAKARVCDPKTGCK